jgi:hypothetical protein
MKCEQNFIVFVILTIFAAGSLSSERGTALTQENAPHERQLYAATSENSPAPNDQRLKQEAQRYYSTTAAAGSAT